jgi:TatD DNase family protein
MLIDSHAHLNFKDFKDDGPQVIADCLNSDIWVVNVGAQLSTSRRAVDIAGRYEKGIFATVGHHPIHAIGSSFNSEEYLKDEYAKLIELSKKVVAVGEIGIDFFHDDNNFEKQKEIFLSQISLAKEYDLPIILHSRNSKDGKRNAYAEILKVLKKEKVERGVIHCYGGTLEEAKEFLALGFFVGFTGVITFPKTEKLSEVIHFLPLERILVETDCPYLAPVPHRGQRNMPQYVKFVAEKIATIKEVDYQQVAEATFNNAKKLFKI